jgi:hypothetical protein
MYERYQEVECNVMKKGANKKKRGDIEKKRNKQKQEKHD